MKDIELPITQTFSITVHKFDTSKAVDAGGGKYMIPLGTIVDESISAVTETARRNGGKVLYATTSIEQQIEAVLLRYFMGPFQGHSDKRVMFEREILQSTALSYGAKKELVSKVINDCGLLIGKDKNKLQGYLKQIMEWRNAFAHGKVKHDSMRGCFVKYYSGSPKTLSLTDKYWDTVEDCFRQSNALLKDAYDKLDQQNI